MGYTDYKSGQVISREQYIANGLERGELLVKLECGCVVIHDRTADAYIVYCPKHEAAPEMYEACDLVQRAWVGDGVDMAIAVDACLLAISNVKE